MSEPAAPETGKPSKGTVLVVDDHRLNRTVVRKSLEINGYGVLEAENGEHALKLCSEEKRPDVIVLDILMPGMNGFEVCHHLKTNPATREIPVLIVTALSGREERIQGIEAGAQDFLTKPIDLEELLLRVRNAVHSKRLLDSLERERDDNERLLLNVLPSSVAARIKEGETSIAEVHRAASVLIAELVGFTDLAGLISPEQVVFLLNEIYSGFDSLVEKHGVEKLRALGNRYLVVSGVPEPRPDHAAAVAALALEMRENVERFNREYNLSVRLRLCITSGPVVAGVIGRQRFGYDVWGTTVNAAWTLNAAVTGPEILISPATWEELQHEPAFECKRVRVFNTSAYILRPRTDATAVTEAQNVLVD